MIIDKENDSGDENDNSDGNSISQGVGSYDEKGAMLIVLEQW